FDDGHRWFVGSHPIAGSHKSGPAAGDPDLFRDRLCVVTPTERTEENVVERAIHFWRGFGMNVEQRTPEEHDRILGRTSHLPHLTAAALAGVVDPGDLPFAGGGFRDSTRIAAGDPDLWTPILLQNREAMLRALGDLQHRLNDFRSALAASNAAALRKLLSDGKQRRDALGN
ncbi:MAG: prephenate dehydrogenase, partial [Planctomycetia bacterium]